MRRLLEQSRSELQVIYAHMMSAYLELSTHTWIYTEVALMLM